MKETIVHYGETGMWKTCAKWQLKVLCSIKKEEVTCKRCKKIMGWT